MNDSEVDHLLELAHGYIEKSLSSSQVAELESILSRDPEARRHYLDFLQDHAMLHWEHVAGKPDSEDFASLAMPRLRKVFPIWQVLAAAALVTLLAVVLKRPVPVPPASFASMKKTESARWESGSLPTADGARLGEGNLELVRGLATIAFDSGAEVVLEAPARLRLVDGINCVLESGTAVAEVGSTALGFTIHTPNARVIDHGTRFAVNVDPSSGATQTQVFDGLVEVEEPGTKKRISLREGQQTLVASASLGGVVEASEEGTWAKPEAPVRPREEGIRILTTADPEGADAYIWGGNPTTHVSDTLLLLKNGRENNAPHRKSYLRFSLGDIPAGSIAEARLELRFTPTGWGLASHLDDAVFTVYGLVDDSLDDWDPASLDWNRAPANETGSGNGILTKQVRKLGQFTVPRGIQNGSFGIRGGALKAFLNEDANRRATLIVVRETKEQRGGGLVHAVASSRHPTLPPPSLYLKVAD
ncbi:MAG: DNRLRE domain-containing protein [Verrucomicrobiae bacterium]|nr:DNRLRE domain-containing protein [Verrucomicrobiae bacterium]